MGSTGCEKPTKTKHILSFALSLQTPKLCVLSNYGQGRLLEEKQKCLGFGL